LSQEAARRPVDKLRTAAGTRETGIVKVGLVFRHIVGRDLHRGNARGDAVVRPELVFVRARGAVLVSPEKGFALLVECLRQDMSL
jgi:hypothetical protein